MISPFDGRGGLTLPTPNNTITDAADFPPVSQRSRYMFFCGADFTDADTGQDLRVGNTYYWLIPEGIWVNFSGQAILAVGFILNMSGVLVAQSISSIGVSQPVEGLDLTLDALSSEFSVSQSNTGQTDNQSSLIYNGVDTKKFLINFSSKIDGEPTDVVGIGLFKNGAAIANSFGGLREGNDYFAERDYALSLSTSDALKLGVLNDTSLSNVSLASMQLMATEIGSSVGLSPTP